MNDRERFIGIMSHQPADRLPLMEIEGREAATVARWKAEGQQVDVSADAELGVGGVRYLPVNMYPEPLMDPVVVREDDDYVYTRNFMGIVVKEPKGAPEFTYEGYDSFPVSDLASWRDFRDVAYSCPITDRFGSDWGPQLWDDLNASDQPVGLLLHPFFFRLGLFTLGLENFMIAFYEDPDLINEMFAHRAQMSLDIIAEATAHVNVDIVVIAEDFAYRTGPHISNKMYADFWDPHQPPVLEAVRKADIPFLSMWSSGDLRPILPTLIERGFNVTWPCEAFCDMHAVELNKEFGTDMAFAGNIGIREVAAGRESIDHEIETKVKPLMETGGFIPTLDDQTPPEISWDDYRYYIERLKAL